MRAALSGCISPDLILDGSGRLELPNKFSVRIGGSSGLYSLIRDTDTFLAQTQTEVCGVLDALFLVLRRNVYDVVRFRCCEEHRRGSITLVRALLSVLTRVAENPSQLAVAKRVVRLLGVVAPSGLTGAEFKDYMRLLTGPSALTLSLLQTLATMLATADGEGKAAPSAFFCVGGSHAGLFVDQSPISCDKDFQLVFWFRAESFSTTSPDKEPSIFGRQHLLSCLSHKNEGFGIFIDNNTLQLYTSDGKGDPQVIQLEEVCFFFIPYPAHSLLSIIYGKALGTTFLWPIRSLDSHCSTETSFVSCSMIRVYLMISSSFPGM